MRIKVKGSRARCNSSGNVLWIGIANNNSLLTSNAFRRAVTLLSFGRLAVNLVKLRVVHMAVESPLHGLQVGAQSIAGQLDSIRETIRQIIIHKDSSGKRHPRRANDPGWNQFAIRVDCCPGPYVTSAGVLRGYLWRHVLRFCVAERPALIDLYTLAVQTTHHTVLIIRASRASIYRQLYHCVDGSASQPAGGAEGVSLAKSGYHHRAGLAVQAVHTDYYA